MDDAIKQQHRIGRPPSCTCGVCRKCKWAAYMRGWYQRKTVAERREYAAKRDPDAVKRGEMNRNRPEDHNFRQGVRRRTSRAVAKGLIARGNCERCGAANVHAHHEDYTKELEVTWLCPYHHSERHTERAAEAGF